MSTRAVTIIQEYVPQYRVPLFAQMRVLARDADVDLKIAAGLPQGAQRLRSDARAVADIGIRQTELRLAGRRVTYRRIREIYDRSQLTIVEQARRNLDVYTQLARGDNVVATWGHGRDFTESRGAVSRSLSSWVTRRSSWFFGYTPESVDAVVEMGFPRSRTTVVWNSTDTTSVRRDLDEIRESGDGDGYDPVLARRAVFIGALDDSKRIPFLLRAAELIAERRPDFRLDIYGAGSLEQLVRERSHTADWLDYHGPATGKGLARALISAQAVAMPGRVGLVAVDALAAGVPVVTTDWPLHGPERWYLDDSCSVNAPNTVEGFARALERAVYDTQLNMSLRSGCAQRSRNLSIEHMAANFVAGISEALEGLKR